MERPTDSHADARRVAAPWIELALWLAAWCVARGALVLSLGDVFFYGEELEKACAGKAMLDGLGVPHHQLAYHDYEGGGFVVSHLDALAFLVFGQSLLAVKLVALALGAGVLAAGWALTQHFGGRVASRVFALLFVLAPASVQSNSLLALGIHFHAMLFAALVLLFAGRLLIDGERGARTWFLLGLSSGFGLYFSYQLALTLAVVGAALAWRLRGELLTRTTVSGLLGFVLGLAPLLWMAAQVGGEVLDIHGASLASLGAKKLETLGQFAGSFGALPWLAAACGAATLVLASWAALADRRGARARTLTAIVLVALALFLAAYLAGAFTVGRVIHYFPLHRLVPAWFLGLVVIAIGTAAAWRDGSRLRKRLLGWLVLISATLGASPIVRAVQSDWGAGWSLLARTKGYAYAEYLGKLQHHVEGERASKLAVFLRFDEPHPELLHAAIAQNLYADGSLPLDLIRGELARAGVGDDRAFLLGLGYDLRERHVRAGGAKDDIAGRVAWLESWAGAARPVLVEAVGRFGLGLLDTHDRLERELALGRDGKLPDEYFVGLGHRAWNARGDLREAYGHQPAHPLALDPRWLARCAEELHDERIAVLLRRGYEQAVRERSLTTR